MRREPCMFAVRDTTTHEGEMRKLILALVLCHPLHWVIMGAAAWAWPAAPAPQVHMAKVITMAVLDAAEPELRWMEMDADLLADVALGEDSEALAAVMWVVLNRACPVRPYGPTCQSFEATIQNGQAFGSVRRGRFRPSWHRVPGRRWARFYPGHWAQAQETAWDVLLGLRSDPTGGADHFHRAGTWRPPWAPTDVSWVLVGSHHFYRAGA